MCSSPRCFDGVIAGGHPSIGPVAIRRFRMLCDELSPFGSFSISILALLVLRSKFAPDRLLLEDLIVHDGSPSRPYLHLDFLAIAKPLTLNKFSYR